MKDSIALHEIPTKFISEETKQVMINFHKLRLLAALCLNIDMYRLPLHNLREDAKIADYLRQYPVISDEDELFKMSRKLEAKVNKWTHIAVVLTNEIL